MGNYEADAFVVVRADTKPFRDELLRSIKQFESKPVKIKVVPDITGFKRLLSQMVAQQSSTVLAKVKVVPDMRGFRAAVAAATKGLPTAGGRGTAATGGGGGRARGPAAVFSDSGKRLTGAAAETKREADARKKLQLEVVEAVRKAEIKAHAENLKRDKARAAADKKARIEAIEAARAAGLVDQRGRPLTGAAREAKAESLERQRLRAEEIAKIGRLETEAHKRNVKLDKDRAKKAADAQRKELEKLRDANLLDRRGRPLTGAALEARQEANARRAAQQEAIADMQKAEKAAHNENMRRDRLRAKAIRDERIAAIEAAAARDRQTSLARGSTRRAGENLIRSRDFAGEGATAAAQARSKLARANDVVRQSESAFSKTIGTNDRLLQARAAATLRSARASAVHAAAMLDDTLATEANNAALKRQTATGLRGFGAQIATFAGLRGATLAASSAFIGGTIAAVAFGKAVASAARFESDLNVFRVTAGATADEMGRVSDIAQELGRDITLPGVSASDAAQSMQLLARAGLSIQDSIGGARGVLQLATAAQISYAEATQLSASALNAFELSGDQAVHVADVLTNAANAAQGEITDMGIALQQSSAVARQVGLGLEETVTFLTLLARAGIRGSDAGTSLRVALTRLIAPTDQAAAVLDKLNIELRDQQGNLRPDVFNQIAEAQKNLSREQQDANAKIIFGVDALRAYSIIARQGRSAFRDTQTEINRQGSAAELAGARMAGLTGKVENLKNQLSALGLTIGRVLVPPLEVITIGITTFFEGINNGIAILGNAIGKIDDLAASIGNLAGRLDLNFNIGGLNIDIDKQVGRIGNVIGKAFSGEDFRNARSEVGQLSQKLAELKQSQKEAADAGRDFQVDIQANEASKLTQELIKLGVAAEKSGSSNRLRAFLRGITDALPAAREAFADGIITPSERAELSLTHLGSVFLRFLPKGALRGLGADLRSSIEDASRQAGQGIDNMGLHIRGRIEDASRQAVVDARKMGKDIADAIAEGLALGVTRATNQLSGLEREALDIRIAGGSGEQAALLQNLERREAIARRKVAKREAQRARGDISNEPVTAAKNELNEILDEQDQIREQMQSDAEEATRKAEQDAEDLKNELAKQDQALIDAFDFRGRQFDARAFQADQTKILADDLAVERARKKFLFSRIAFFRNRIKDEVTLKKVLEGIREALRQTDAEITNIENQQAENRKTARKTARDAITDALGKQIQLAELKLGPNGEGKSQLLKAIDRAISDARLRVKNYKKLGLVLVDEQIALQSLIKKRDEINNEAKNAKDDNATTAFDLLKTAADTFRASGGNLIGGAQPFAGPTGFTADIAQFLQRDRGAAAPTLSTTGKFPASDSLSRNDQAHFQGVIEALDRNTDALLGKKGNRTTITEGSLDRLNKDRAKFHDSTQTRKVREARSGI